MATTSPRRGVTVHGFVSPGVALLALAAAALGTFIPGAVASSHSESLMAMFYDVVFIAVGVSLVVLTGTARIVAAGEGLRVTNLFQVITVDARAITAIESSRGLVIITTGGRRIRTFAYGASFAGDLLGYRRARAAQGRFQAWLATLAHREPQSQDDDVSVALRPAVWLLPPALLIAYVAEVLIVRALT